MIEARELVLDDPRRALDLLDEADLPSDLLEEAANLTLLARIVLKLDDPGELPESDAGRRYLEGIRSLRDRDFDVALCAFIDALRLDPALAGGDGPSRACTVIFSFLGYDDPVVRRRRGDLAAALYV